MIPLERLFLFQKLLPLRSQTDQAEIGSVGRLAGYLKEQLVAMYERLSEPHLLFAAKWFFVADLIERFVKEVREASASPMAKQPIHLHVSKSSFRQEVCWKLDA